MTYTTTVQTYRGIPFSYRLKKSHYYDIAGSMKGGEILLESTFQSYPGLNMNYYQGTDSLMTVTVNGGTLPNHSYSQGAFGCLATVNEGPGIYTNYIKVGSPDINVETGVVSGFSSSNYLQLPTAFNPGSSSWECIFKVRTGSDVNTNQKLFHSYISSGTFAGRLGAACNMSNAHFGFFCSSDGSSWLFDEMGTYTFSTNTTYWIKIGWTGTVYYLEYSTDGTNYTRDITYNSSSPVYGSLAISNIGIYSTDSFIQPWLGSIDLSGCQIKIDNNTWWTPLVAGLYTVLKSSYVNYTKVGNPSVNTETGVVTGFTASNYLVMPQEFPSSGTYKMIFNTTFKNSVTGVEQSFFARNDNVNITIYFKYSDNNIAYWNGTDYEVGSTTFVDNTKYWIGAEFDSSTLSLKIYSMVDNGTYTLSTLPSFSSWTSEINTTLSSDDFSNKMFRFCTNANTNHYYAGNLDLSGCQISVNNSVYWTPVGGIPVTAVGLLPSGVTDDGTAQTWNLFYKDGDYKLNTASTMSGYDWCGEIAIPAHTV